MKKLLIYLSVLVFSLPFISANAWIAREVYAEHKDTMTSWVVTSPDGSVDGKVEVDQSGAAFYTVIREGETVLNKSPLGMKVYTKGNQDNVIEFHAGLSFLRASEPKEIQEEYTIPARKKAVYKNHCFEREIVFGKQNYEFGVVIRAYDDGVAFRYRINETGGSSGSALNILSEQTGYGLPANSRVWAMPYHQNPYYSFEENYIQTSVSDLKQDMIKGVTGGMDADGNPSDTSNNPEGTAAFPLLYRTTAGTYALLAQAHLTGEYVGIFVKPDNGGMLRTIFPTRQTSSVITTTEFLSPWRLIITGTLAQVTESVMVNNVSPDPDPTYGDFSWVKTGAATWAWMADSTEFEEKKLGQRDKERVKKYISLAAEMGNAFYVLDEAWQPDANRAGERYDGYFDWFDEILDHAKKNKVGLVAWCTLQDFDTPAKRERRFKEWHEKGIVGIKPDFFDSDDQNMIKLYEDVLRDSAKYRLILDWHGCNPGWGDDRTWPHSLTREAIRGQEYYGITAEQYTILPFTRLVMGGADVTESPSAMTPNTSSGFQIALSIISFSPMHTLAGHYNTYRNSTAYDLFKNIPVIWDDSKLVGGEPGNHVSMARQSGKNWYLAAISVPKQELQFSLDYLEEGITYEAVIYNDSPYGLDGLEATRLSVVKGDKIDVRVVANGGCAIKIIHPLAKSPQKPNNKALMIGLIIGGGVLVVGGGVVSVLIFRKRRSV